MPERYGNVVIPILVDAGGKVNHVGSALLVDDLKGSFWLVSAAHVLAQPAGHIVGVPWTRHAMLHLHGSVYSTCQLTPKQAREDRIDVAAVRLEGHVVEGLQKSGGSFLPVDRLERSASIAGCHCALTGYPEGSIEWSFDSVLSKVERVQIHVTLHPNEQVRKRSWQPNIHVVAKYGNTLADGTRQRFPKPEGMSGGAVWILNEDGPMVVGIITTLISRKGYKRALVCTRVGGIVKMIEDPTKAKSIKVS